MDEKQISTILAKHPWTRNYFKGVFSVDDLPIAIAHYPACLVLNLDMEQDPGSHWVAIYIDAERHGEYFDSFGLMPLSRHIYQFLNRHCKQWTFNTTQLQHVISSMCGPYCIFYLLYRCRYKLNMSTTIETFFPKKNRLDSDKLMQKKMLHNFGIYIPLIQTEFINHQLVEPTL